VAEKPAPISQPGARHVALLGVGLVVLVLAAAAATALLPADVQTLVFHTPLLIAVLVVGTALVLWRILRAPGPGGLQ
jgi:FtsH-binding integral membrane protein